MRWMLIFGALLLALSPSAALAAPKAAPLEISGWIPYWRMATGTADVLPRLSTFNALMPFGYIVQNDGTLHDAFNFESTSATSTANTLIAAARVKKVKIIPSIMWSNGAAIHAVLSNTASRIALEDAIAALVKEKGFDGIDIDFESKLAETRPYFSLFLKGLYMRMGQKWVYCTIEPRTPPASAFAVMPKKFEYANDYVAINKYCDRVNIMAYDQGTIDLKLNAAANQAPYIPIGDVQWVEKVVTLAAQTISKKKLVIGVATYGYEYDLIPLAQGYRYQLNWAFNPRYATALAADLGLVPKRNSAGEMSLTYVSTTTSTTNLIASAGSAGPVQATTTPMRIMWWSDAQAINDKIKLAKKLGVRGVAIFKLDGGQDPNIWNVLPKK
ncbi:MAG: glycosyl hydrolase family 18 protein [Candidatus Paceibacterota bacterium]|jgi:spore germination protein YaaH